MPTEQALAPDELTAMRILPVPDLWPPADPSASAPCPPLGQLGPSGPPRPADPGGVQPWPRQFAVLLTDALTGDRPARQVLPWLSERGRIHLQRLRPLFRDGQGARLQRVMTTQPSPDVIEMTLIVAVGPRIRALAVRLALARPEPSSPGWREKAAAVPSQRTAMTARWLCTDIEAG
jgi:hypothetical protein